MHQRLEEIIAAKKNEVAQLKKAGPLVSDRKLPATRDFKAAISAPQQVSLIAEIKFASPSAGSIRPKADPIPIGRIYQDAGAAAISLLTDKRFFQGDLNDLPRLKKSVSLPILRKDFIIDPYQVYEARVIGADCILLIAAALGDAMLAELLQLAEHLHMDCLVEVHDALELERVLQTQAPLIGINNRDLRSFETSLNVTLDMLGQVPDDRLVVTESGIHTTDDVSLMRGHGVHAFLVGEAFMKAPDPGEKLAELFG